MSKLIAVTILTFLNVTCVHVSQFCPKINQFQLIFVKKCMHMFVSVWTISAFRTYYDKMRRFGVIRLTMWVTTLTSKPRDKFQGCFFSKYIDLTQQRTKLLYSLRVKLRLFTFHYLFQRFLSQISIAFHSG